MCFLCIFFIKIMHKVPELIQFNFIDKSAYILCI